MLDKQKLIVVWAKIKNLPKKYTIPAVVFAVILVAYGVMFFIPKAVNFSYANAPCVNQLTLFPDMYRTTGEGFEARPTHLVKIGSLAIAARSVCFLPSQSPKEGVTQVGTSPFGGWFMQSRYSITTTPAPTIDSSVFKEKIPASQPLNIPLSSSDMLFRYILKVDEKQIECEPTDSAVACAVDELKLAQGKSYSAEVIRQFGDQTVDVVKQKITVLPATRVTKTSIKSDEIVYAKPTTLTVVFDKKIMDIDHTFYRLEDGKKTQIKTDVILEGEKIQVKIVKDLPRSAKFELMINSVKASDGSGLEEPYILAFESSGGPKVTGINVGSASVALGSTAIITFDQPLSEEQDINKAVKLAGGATIAGKDGAQLFVSLAGVPKCGDFTIQITNDLESNYGIKGGSEWQHGGRMICHEIAVIGYSHQGRPITAYYFGGGSTSIVYTGAIHGSESSTSDLMYQWINYLEMNARSIPANKTVVVVPQVNPDGIVAGTRTNARNVDLNRNFATSDWQKDVTDVYNNPFPGGGGEASMSEPETQTIAGLVSQLRPALVLSYHSIGGLVVANQAGSSSAQATTYAQLSGYYNATGQSSPFEYGISGTADDWYAQKLGVASVLIELGSHTYHQFDRNRDAMWAMLQ